MAIENSIRISQLDKVDQTSQLNGNQYFLGIKTSETGSWKNIQIQYQAISDDIAETAIGRAKTYTNEQIAALNTSFTDQLTSSMDINAIRPINNIKHNASDMPSLTAVYQKGRETAALSIVNLSNELLTKQTGKLDMLSTGLSTIAKAYVDENIQVVNGHIAEVTSTVDGVNTNLTNLASRVDTLTGNISTALQLKLAFDNTNDKITGVENNFNNFLTSPATATEFGLIKIGYVDDPDSKCYGVKLNAENKAYVNIPNSGGGGGGGGSLPVEWPTVKEYVLTTLFTLLGESGEKYSNTIVQIENIADALSTQIQYFNDVAYANAKYDVVKIDSHYTSDGTKYYVATDDDVIEDSVVVGKQLIQAPNIIYATSVILNPTDGDYYIDGDGNTKYVSDLHDNEIIEEYHDDELVATYVIEEDTDSTKYAIKINELYKASSVILDSADSTIATSYVIQTYSILNRINAVQNALQNFIDEGVYDKTRQLLNELFISDDIYNNSSVSINANSTKTIFIQAPNKVVHDDTYKPLGVDTIEINDNDIEIVSATIFNNKVSLTLLNTSNDAKVFNVNSIKVNLTYRNITIIQTRN